MKFCSFFLLFCSLFLFFNGNVEAIEKLIEPVLSLINIVNSILKGGPLSLPQNPIDVVKSNLGNLQLPVKHPLPALGTTSCSTYKHANVSVEHFKEMCYTQLHLQPDGPNYPYKCRKSQFKVDQTLTNVPFQLSSIVGFTPKAGFASVEYKSKTDGSLFFYNFTFVEAQQAEPIIYVTNGVNLTMVQDSVITHYTDKGYVYLICPVNDLDKPLCSSPKYVFVCTYAQFPVDPADVDDLVTPLNDYPYYLGKSLYKMDQTGC